MSLAYGGVEKCAGARRAPGGRPEAYFTYVVGSPTKRNAANAGFSAPPY